MVEPTNAGLVLYTVYAVLSIYLLVKLLSVLPCGTHTEQENPYRYRRKPRRISVMPIIIAAAKQGAARLDKLFPDDDRNPLEW